MHEHIHIQGATHHNLKNLEISIPRNKLVVICGPSGSGKSTLAFDIIYAEGQRRYVESLSAYARQFLPQLDKPEVEKIEGLSPAISLEQHTTSKNPRSTVGTVTEVYDFLRVFFARLGTPFCPQCHRPIQSRTSDEIIDSILALPEGSKFLLLAPVVEGRKGTQAELFKKLKSQGFVRVRVDNRVHPLEQIPELDKNKRHTVEVVVDRLVLKQSIRKRLADSLELALNIGSGGIIVSLVRGEDLFYSTEAVCPDCKISLPKPSPQLFSFNSPQGACQHCSGLGSVEYFEPLLIVPNKGLSLNQGGIVPWKKERVFAGYKDRVQALGLCFGFDLNTPLKDFSEQAFQALFYGSDSGNWPGVVTILQSGMEFGRIWRDELSRFRQTRVCPVCAGARLRPEALAVRIEKTTIRDFCNWSILACRNWLHSLDFSGFQARIAEPILKELSHRLEFLSSVGLDYLSLDRNMSSLSG